VKGDRKAKGSPKGVHKRGSALGFHKGAGPFAPWQTLPETRYSTLLPYQVPQVSRAFRRICPEAAWIIDATAHVGGDTANFARLFPNARIDAIELDARAFRCLQTNMAPWADRVRVLHADCTDVLLRGAACDPPLRTRGGGGGGSHDQQGPGESCVQPPAVLEASIAVPRGFYKRAALGFVYMDPPWGGPNYYLHPVMNLELSGKLITDIVPAVLRRNPSLCVVLKAPANFDVAALQTALGRLPGTMDVFPIHKRSVNHKGSLAYNLIACKQGVVTL
jgi:hypothetical protein